MNVSHIFYFLGAVGLLAVGFVFGVMLAAQGCACWNVEPGEYE